MSLKTVKPVQCTANFRIKKWYQTSEIAIHNCLALPSTFCQGTLYSLYKHPTPYQTPHIKHFAKAHYKSLYKHPPITPHTIPNTPHQTFAKAHYKSLYKHPPITPHTIPNTPHQTFAKAHYKSLYKHPPITPHTIPNTPHQTFAKAHYKSLYKHPPITPHTTITPHTCTNIPLKFNLPPNILPRHSINLCTKIQSPHPTAHQTFAKAHYKSLYQTPQPHHNTTVQKPSHHRGTPSPQGEVKVRSGEILWDLVKSCEIWWDLVRSGEIFWDMGEIRWNQDK